MQAFSDLLQRLDEDVPFPDARARDEALERTLQLLGALLPSALVKQLAAELPAECKAELKRKPPELSSWSHERALADGTLEPIEAVCRFLSKVLKPPLPVRLAAELPPELAEAFLPRERPSSPFRDSRPGEHTLASGRPGSAHPMSSSTPGARHPLSSSAPARGSENSVANPHAHEDTKLSTARGLTQEREGETLAEGRPKR